MTANPTQLPATTDRMVVAIDLPRLTADEAFGWFTQPARLVRWWPQAAETDPRAGGRYALSWPSMNWRLSGEYLVFEPSRRLVFTWQWDHRPDLPARKVEVAFAAAGVGSRVIITHSAYGPTAAEQADRQSHIDGWLHFLARLYE